MTNIVQFPPSDNGDENPFDKIKHVESGIECWYARELMPLLDYQTWEKFLTPIEKAKQALININADINSNFSYSEKVVQRSNGKPYTIQDYRMSRHFCYLVAMNGDSRKLAIAFAQAYFAAKTQEAEERLKQPINVDSLDIAESIMLAFDEQSKRLEYQVRATKALIQANREMVARIAQAEQKIEELHESTVVNSDAIASIQETQERAKAELEKIDLPEFPAKGISDRKKITWLVNTYVRSTNVSHTDVWRELYQQFLLRYSINLKVRANNATADRKKKVDRLDILEELKMCGDFYAMAYDVLINQPT